MAREVLPRVLRESGAIVDVLVVYETIVPKYDEACKNKVREADVITFTSPSTVENFVKILGNEGLSLCETKTVVSIGPVTTQKAKELGLKVDVTSEDHSIPGLIQALKRYLLSV